MYDKQKGQNQKVLRRNKMYLSEEYKKKIVDFFTRRLNPKLIYLFGSFAKGEGREDSDIDLAIYTEEVLKRDDLFILSNTLAFEVKMDV